VGKLLRVVRKYGVELDKLLGKHGIVDSSPRPGLYGEEVAAECNNKIVDICMAITAELKSNRGEDVDLDSIMRAYQFANVLASMRFKDKPGSSLPSAGTAVAELKNELCSCFDRSGIHKDMLEDIETAKVFCEDKESTFLHDNIKISLIRRKHVLRYRAVIFNKVTGRTQSSEFINCKRFIKHAEIIHATLDKDNDCGILFVGGVTSRGDWRYWSCGFKNISDETMEWGEWEEFDVKYKGAGRLIRATLRQKTIEVTATTNYGTFDMIYWLPDNADGAGIRDTLNQFINKQIIFTGSFKKNDIGRICFYVNDISMPIISR